MFVRSMPFRWAHSRREHGYLIVLFSYGISDFMKLELFWWDYPGKNLRERPVIVLSSFVTRTTDPIRPFTKGKKKRKLHSIENRNIDRVV